MIKNSGGGIKNAKRPQKELSNELAKSIIRKFNQRKAHSFFVGNIWGADIPDMELMSKSNKEICFFLLFIINIFSKYAWITFLKDKKLLELIILLKKF